MPQEENEINWFDSFKGSMNVLFSQKEFNKYDQMVKNELRFYGKYLKKGAKILDIGCGLGCTAVPLSRYGYRIVGLDNDKCVVNSARKNSKKFGKRINIMYGDIFNINKLFGKDSFDACISGGVLEHFPREQIRKIMDKQLYIAPLVIASMPVATSKNVRWMYKDYKKRICKDGIYRNYWTGKHWINNIFRGYNILKYKVGKTSKAIGGFDEVIVVISRNKK